MLHFHSFEEVTLSNAWATIGTFDGVHRGHLAILAPLVKAAHAAGNPAAVVTFYPHPVAVLRGIQDPYYLTTPDERADLLGAVGIDAVITLTFDHALAALTAEEFMQRVKRHLGLRELWVGYDFALGRNRQGDIPTLRRLGEEMGYDLRVIEEISLGGMKVSSSQIRGLLAEGKVAQAAQQLGRPYSLEGEVIHGDGRGKGLGIPTANLAVWPHKIVPAKGVYATWTWVKDSQSAEAQRVPAVTNVGVRPTFENQPELPRIEAHLLDFDHDLYDQTVKLEFLEYLRPEQRFASIDALLAQIAQDTNRAKEVFSHAP
jgi:riboflavin kinase / FMN adenylyltransferase